MTAFTQFSLPNLSAPLTVEIYAIGAEIRLTWHLPTAEKCWLHWGLVAELGGGWTRPPQNYCPADTVVFDQRAMRTPFQNNGDGTAKIVMDLPLPMPWNFIEFVLFFPATNAYVKNHRDDFNLHLPKIAASVVIGAPAEIATPENKFITSAPVIAETPEEFLQRLFPAATNNNLTRFHWHLDNGDELDAVVETTPEAKTLTFATNVATPLFLHWGLTDRFHSRWFLPPDFLHPAGTTAFDARAVRSPFVPTENLATLTLKFPHTENGAMAIAFLLYAPNGEAWLKHQDNDLTLTLFADEFSASPFADEKLTALINEIIAAEVGRNSWTLMHRYDLAKNLLARFMTTTSAEYRAAAEIIFVWLRYSAIRQLDWQRHYNTKPRDLAWAQKTLTQKIAAGWRDFPAARAWSRRLLQTVGRGGEGGQGQQIRDEILNIMHRHHLKEAHGHFIEEWHQKLHNNTTPDDIEICRAFLAFMRANGDLKVFYDTLAKNGVTRERLRNFERPIVTDPEFYAHCKDGVIADFENYLRILQTVHGGAEIETAAARALPHLPDAARRIYEKNKAATPTEIVNLRREVLQVAANEKNPDAILDLLYFDLALADKFNNAYMQFATNTDTNQLFADALMNSQLLDETTGAAAELHFCQTHWERWRKNHDATATNAALEALSIIERTSRMVQAQTAEIATALTTPADYLGKNFNVAEWTRQIFVEEVIRGSDWFALAKIIDYLLKSVRKTAGIGGWQLISPANVFGKILRVENLRSVLNEQYTEPTIILTDHVGGDEDAPAGCVGLITRVAPDLVAHLSVRARNLGILLAACYDDEVWEKLVARSEISENWLTFKVVGGGIEFNETNRMNAATQLPPPTALKPALSCLSPAPPPTDWVIPASQFTRELLGGKSNNLNLLRGKLPAWMNLPEALGLPFGTCERVLNDADNRGVLAELNAVIAQAEHDPLTYLPTAREIMLNLNAPQELSAALKLAWEKTDFPEFDWEKSWRAIKKVWASKWNERAFLSRRQIGMPHANLLMAVLIQQVVNAEYAFVIHTVNPLTGNANEVFAEVVLGLGETLVGNFTGHALGFICEKNGGKITYTTYPSKDIGLYGRGVIFRSDSNGEDLSGFAGAGLYDSILAENEHEKLLDYTNEKILVDKNFREQLIRQITAIAIAVEQICGGAQDIEGAVHHDGRFYIVQNRPQVGL